MNYKIKKFDNFVNENTVSTGNFIKGDEVYLVGGDGEPFGKVAKVTDKYIHVFEYPENKDERLGKTVIKKPSELYRAPQWHEFNTKE